MRCIRYVMQAVYSLPIDDARVKYTENIFIRSNCVDTITSYIGHDNPEVRNNALYTLYYLTPTKKILNNEILLGYTPQVFEIMSNNENSAKFITKFYPNPEEVSEENRIALYLMDGMTQYKQSHQLIQKGIYYY